LENRENTEAKRAQNLWREKPLCVMTNRRFWECARLHQKVKNDGWDGSSAKRGGNGFHDELAAAVGIGAGTQTYRDGVTDLYFFHVGKPSVSFK